MSREIMMREAIEAICNRLSEGDSIKFNVGFNAFGPIAQDLS